MWCLVVSPLIALMVDQVGSLHKRGVASAIMSDHEGVDRSVVLSEKDTTSTTSCAPEAV